MDGVDDDNDSLGDIKTGKDRFGGSRSRVRAVSEDIASRMEIE